MARSNGRYRATNHGVGEQVPDNPKEYEFEILFEAEVDVGCVKQADSPDRCVGAERLDESNGSEGFNAEPAPTHQTGSTAPLDTPYDSTGLAARAERDLDEAESIAERGSMLIWQIEAALERARLFLTLAAKGRESFSDLPVSSNVADLHEPYRLCLLLVYP